MGDELKAALESDLNEVMGGGEPKPAESEKPSEQPAEPELPAAPKPDDAAPAKEEADPLANYRTKLSTAGLKNQAEQGERWYKQWKAAEQAQQELNRKLSEMETRTRAEESERQKVATEADTIMSLAPADASQQWADMRREYGDAWLIKAYRQYLNDLRKVDASGAEVQELKRRQAEQDRVLKEERERREVLERERTYRDYEMERDAAISKLGVTDPAEVLAYKAAVHGAFLAAHDEAFRSGKKLDLRVSDVVNDHHLRRQKEREALREALRKEIAAEAAAGRQKAEKRDEPPAKQDTGKGPKKSRFESMRDTFARDIEGS